MHSLYRNLSAPEYLASKVGAVQSWALFESACRHVIQSQLTRLRIKQLDILCTSGQLCTPFQTMQIDMFHIR